MAHLDSDTVSFGSWSLNTGRKTLHVDGAPARVQPGLLKLLMFLVGREGQVISKTDLIDAVWDGREITDAAIYNRVSALRTALRDDDVPERCIKWDYGRGLCFERPGHRPEENPIQETSDPVPSKSKTQATWFDGAVKTENLQHLLGSYHVFFRTPSWPGAINVSVSVIQEIDGRLAVRTIENGKNLSSGIWQNAKYSGHAEFIDGRVYIFEQNHRPPRAVCMTVLDAPQGYQPQFMTGIMSAAACRLHGAPFAARVIWRRVRDGVSLLQALRESGPKQDHEIKDPAIVESIDTHCLTFQASQNFVPQAIHTSPSHSPGAMPARPKTRHGPSIVAVLPFRNREGGEAVTSFGQTLVDRIITHLSKFWDIEVLARQSYVAAKGLNASAIGAEIGAHYLIEGSYHLDAGGIQILPKLVNAENEVRMWAEAFVGPDQDWTPENDKVASVIAGSVIVQINRHERQLLHRKKTEELGAWECYQLGCGLKQSPDFADRTRALEMFQRAIDLDPEFALAYASYAAALSQFPHQSNLTLQMGHASTSPQDQVFAVMQYARRAVQLAPRMPFAWVALARAHLISGAAEQAIDASKKAIELNGSMSSGFCLHGFSLLQKDCLKEAVKEFEHGLNIAPESSYRHLIIGGISCAMVALGQFEKAIEWSQKTQQEPSFAPTALLAEVSAFGHLSRIDEARVAASRAGEQIPNFGSGFLSREFPGKTSKVHLMLNEGLRRAGM